MKISPINNTAYFQGNKKETKERKAPVFEEKNPFLSKRAMLSFAVQRLYKRNDSIPSLGEIPQSVIQKCSTGEKGLILNKKTGEKADISAKIVQAKGAFSDHRVLYIYDKDKEIGYASFKTATKENPCLMSADDYVGEDGAIYVDYMQNNYKDTYSHVGTLMHRLLHELSKQEGHKGKMILDSMHRPAPFHYDSGFIPLASFNADNEFWKISSKLTELMIIRGKLAGSCCMCLDENKMQQLENGEHCIPKDIQEMDEDEFYDYYDELNKTMRHLRFDD